jgi:hypothetical protein
MVFSGHRLKADDRVSVSDGHDEGNAARERSGRQCPGGAATRRQSSATAGVLNSWEQSDIWEIRAHLANRYEATRSAMNADPAFGLVMKAPWLDHRNRHA